MNKLNPVIFIMCGLLCLSIGLNFIQRHENNKIKILIDKQPKSIIIDIPDPYPYPHQNKYKTVRKIFKHTT